MQTVNPVQTPQPISEIKSVRGASPHGVNEIAKYVNAHNQNCKLSSELPYFKGTNFFDFTLPWIGKKSLKVYYHKPRGSQTHSHGVISYDIDNNGGVKSPSPSPVPVATYEILKELLDRIEKSTKTVAEVVNEFLDEYPHVAPTLIIGCVMIAASAFGATLGTGGAAIVVTGAIMVTATIIISAAWSYTPSGTTGGA